MKKLIKYGSLVALSTGLLIGGGITHAQTLTPYDNTILKFKTEKENVKNTRSTDFSKVFSLVRQGAKPLALTGNVIYETEPNDYIYNANTLNMGDSVVGTLSYYDVDVFKIYVPQSGRIAVAGSMPVTSLADLGFYLSDQNDNLINPVASSSTQYNSYAYAYDLQAGTYYIHAADLNNAATSDYYAFAWDLLGAVPPPVDTTPPAAPTVNKVSESDHIVTGTAEPNSTVDVVKGGILLGEAYADTNGHFSVSIPPERGGTVISVFATDAAGNVGAPTTVTVTATLLNGWIVKGGQHYYYVNNVIQKSWLTVSGKKYFLDPSTGIMKTGWVLNGGKWYYFNKTTGVMTTGWILDGKWYYLNPDGSMKTGWLYYNKNWYFLNKDGSMATGWVYTGGKWYYMYSSGIMAHDTKIGSYRIDHNGVWIH